MFTTISSQQNMKTCKNIHTKTHYFSKIVNKNNTGGKLKETGLKFKKLTVKLKNINTIKVKLLNYQ